MTLAPSPAWRLVLEEGRLFALAGADALYLVDEVAPAEAEALHAAFATGDLSGLAARSPALALALQRLERLGALAPTVARAPDRPLAVAVTGVPADHGGLGPLVGAIDALLASGTHPVRRVTDGGCDLTVLVRAGGTLVALGEEAARLTTPHLLVDVGYARTVVLGPLVHPGETACLGCLSGRVVRTWGDPEPPPAPHALTGAAPLVAGLVVEALQRVAREGSHPSLVGRTVVLSLDGLTARSEPVHRLPWCPFCFPREELRHGTGAFALPWLPPPTPKTEVR